MKSKISLEIELDVNKELLDNINRSDTSYGMTDMVLCGAISFSKYNLILTEGDDISLSNPQVESKICKVIELLADIDLETDELKRR